MKHTITAILIFIVIGCKVNNHDSPERIIELTSNRPTDPVETFNDIIKSVSYVPLETNEKCLISKVSQLEITDSNIFILEGAENRVLRFSDKGKFLNEIGSRGKGPGEFLRITCFRLNNLKEEIMVYDRRQKKILTYSYNGKFIDEVNFDFYFNVFFEDEDGGYWAFTNNNGNKMKDAEKLNFVKIEENGEINTFIYGVKNYNFLWCNGAHASNHSGGDTISFVLPVQEGIYSFYKGEINKKYTIDFKDAQVPDKLKRSISSSDRNDRKRNQNRLNEIMKKYAVGYLNLIELKDWIYFTYSYSGKTRFVLFNKSGNKTYDWNKTPYNKDCWETYFPILYGKNNSLYSCFHPINMIEYFDAVKRKFSEKRLKSIEEFLNETDIDNNPIIIRYEI